jgi:hypothetical protein
VFLTGAGVRGAAGRSAPAQPAREALMTA